ncbi:MAG: paraquat-inducible protein A [Phycisphaerales bacterium]|nr:paraquat-inducible protein A [Phycisphaerales bacterium]
MRHRTMALALAALALYPVAIGLPVMTLTQLGHAHQTGIVQGGIDLLTSGNIAIGLLVLVCSVLLPLGKLGALLVLAGDVALHPVRQAWIHRVVEWTGRWGMLDVLLVAILVAAVKLGDVVEVSLGPGALAFAACVALSLAASAAFDPHLLWSEQA